MNGLKRIVPVLLIAGSIANAGLASAQSSAERTSARNVDGTRVPQRYSQDSRSYFDYGEPYFTSMIESADGKSVEVRLSTSSAMFSFVRGERLAQAKKSDFYAVRDITMEVVERGFTQPVLTKSVHDTLYEANYDATTSKDKWHALSQVLELPRLDTSKRYALRLEIRDGILNRPAMRPVIADIHPSTFRESADSNGISLSEVTLYDSVLNGTATTKARGNTYMFSRDVLGAVSFKLSEALPKNASVIISIRQISNLGEARSIGPRGQVSVPTSDIHQGQILTLASAGSTLTYTLTASSDPNLYTAIFKIPGESFEQGKYEISASVVAGESKKARTNEFSILWQDMPLSLEDPQDAIQPLAHVMNEDAFDQLKSGSKQEMAEKLYQYWKKQDPTPGTAYNERMAAFYQRVDYADFNFATTRLLDGVMSDRGKIYLLYGAPSNIERTFLPGQPPVETWTYSNNVQREFRFEDKGATRGDYKLIDVKALASLEPQGRTTPASK